MMEKLFTVFERAGRPCLEDGAGRPADEIVKRAQAEGSDLIIVGSRGLTEVRAFLLGSVSDKVCYLARCPTLVVK